eukprot:UN32665
MQQTYSNRLCPECGGDFVKMRNPAGAYHGVGIVCDGCHEKGSAFSGDGWYFQCSGCEQVDVCLSCMMKLDALAQKTKEAALPTFRIVTNETGDSIFEAINPMEGDGLSEEEEAGLVDLSQLNHDDDSHGPYEGIEHIKAPLTTTSSASTKP